MPDMLLPQVPPAPAPAKAAASSARSAEAKPESESDQEFSNVLKTRMQPEKEAASAETKSDAPAAAVSSDDAVATDAEGKPLPQPGNAEAPELAALAPLLGAAGQIAETGEPTTSPESAATVPQAAVEAADVIADLPTDAANGTPVPASAPQQAEAVAGKKPMQQAVDAAQMRGPWKTGAAELPEAAQKSVAQAVRSAVMESDSGATPGLMPQGFGAEVRAAVAATRHHTPGLESALERLTANTAQPATPATAAAQTLSAPAAQDAGHARTALPSTAVDMPLRQPGWDQALGERVLWVASQKFQGAEIKLNPAHLGPVEVRVQLHNDQAQISFTAQHATTREALEAALPRLREMFNASGYSQVDVNVSQHSFAEQHRHAQGFEGRFQAFARNGDEGDPAAGALSGAGRVTSLPTSAIDVFA